MGSIAGISSTRVSDLMLRQQLTNQIDASQTQMLQAQEQLSTGKSFQLPGENPTAALEATDLQRLVAQNSQVQTNIQSAQSYLSATDSAMTSISSLLSNIRATALGAVGTTETTAQQQAAAAQIEADLQQLVSAGNQQFDGRYLFGGSENSAPPFTINSSGAVQYSGNNVPLQSYSDIGQLMTTNVTGDAAFGALSAPVGDASNLDPALTFNTPLASLNGGNGVASGSIQISNGTNTSTIDLSGATTIGEVAQLIEAHPPAGATLNAVVTSSGLQWQLTGGGQLSVSEVGNGTTAADLGIATTAPPGMNTILPQNLNPTLTGATQLSDLLGRPSQAVLQSSAADSDVLFSAAANGTQNDGIQIQLVADPTVTAGYETVNYSGNTLTIGIAAGQTTAADVANAVHAAFLAGQSPLDAQTNPADGAAAGQGIVDVGMVTTGGGQNGSVDLTSGLQIVNGGKTYTVSLAGAQTVSDVLNALNTSGAGVVAQINSTGSGIAVSSQISGADFEIGENGGNTATSLGIRSLTASTPLADLNYASGVQPSPDTDAGTDFTIQQADGNVVSVDTYGDTNIQDVLNSINNSSSQEDPPTLKAQLSPNGNGIQLTDSSLAAGTGTLTVSTANGSQVAVNLGLIPVGQTSNSAPTATPQTLTGTDPNPQEASGILNAVSRLQQAVAANDQAGIQRGITLLDSSTTQFSLVEAENGAQQQNLQAMLQQQQSQNTALQQSLSTEVDVDFAQAASNYSADQVAYQAALQTTATVGQMSLFNYL